jgi:hypothetical protein
VGRPRPGARHALARPPRSPPGPRGPRAGTGDVGGARGRWRERGGAGFSRSPPRARRPPSQGGVGEVRGDGRPVPLPFFFPPSRPRGRPAVPPDLASAPLRSALSSPGARGRPVASRHSASPPERTDAGSHRWRRSTSCPSVSPCGGLTSYPIAGSTSCLYREFFSVRSLLPV